MGAGNGGNFISRVLGVILTAAGAYFCWRRRVAECSGANLDKVGDFSVSAKAKMSQAWEKRPKNITMPKLPAGGSKAPSAADAETRKFDNLERLAALKEKGILSEEEFQAEKTKVLGGGDGTGAG